MAIEQLYGPESIRRRWSPGLTIKDLACYAKLPISNGLRNIFLPSFLHVSLHHRGERVSKEPLNSSLQGLRGVAAAIVFHRHLLMNFSNFPDYGYGVDKTIELGLANRWIHQLPFLRLVYSGGAMVQMFFIISGYTQSLKPLQQMQKEQWEAVHRSLSSAIFRRGFRLFLPTFAAAMLIAVSVWMGMYDWGSRFRNTWFEPDPNRLTRERTLSRQVWVVLQSLRGLIDVWNWDEYFPKFNPHMWTIAVEFRCSLAVQFTLLVLSMLRPVARLIILTGTIWYCHVHGRWDCVCFLGGLFLAYVNVNRRSGTEETSKYPARSGWKELPKTRTVIGSVCFLSGLYFMGYPKKDGLQTPGYQTIASYSPDTWADHRFWSAWGAFLVVASVINSPVLASFFENSLFQYLGKISFAMYLVHGPVLHIIGNVFVPMIWLVTGRDSIACRVLGFEVATCFVIIPMMVWVADLFWRIVDVPCGNFTFWLKAKIMVT